MYLNQKEVDALRSMFVKTGVLFINEHIPTEARKGLLAKLNLAIVGDNIVDPSDFQRARVVLTVALEDGYTLSVLRHHEHDGMYWYRILSPDGGEIDSGLYVTSEEIAKNQGLRSWGLWYR